ncbi:carbon storage regulator [Psittacicella hinzii]|uniref:Carbon storage regulator n=1 Tax=Psittacicella hinzii TaxID=2028575 RepID=A0A3A1YMX5_9GAMM|nr:carbon storage regulator [Psittacicella hinzii]RIY39035.1 hypothetical protein CKF58_02925 [Psittacicella hinzii]
MTKLLLKRKVGQKIRINSDIEIKVTKVSSSYVCFVVEAPQNNLVSIVNDEQNDK